MDLGEVFEVHFDKTCQTTWLFDKFSPPSFLNDKKYDTLFLRLMFPLYKGERINGKSVETACTVSLYVKEYVSDYKNTIPTCMSITEIKNKYCDNLVCAETHTKSNFLTPIVEAFVNNSFNDKGDYFFEKPLMFVAQNNYSHDSGYGRSHQYYIVGVNFGGVRKSEIQF